MANTAAICNSFKTELMLGAHQFGSVTIVSRTSLTSPTTDAFKIALYQTSATLNKTTTVYSATGEVSSAGYTAAGAAVTNGNAPANASDVTYWTPSASVSWSGVTFTTDCAFLYNDTQGDRAVAVFTFGSQSPSAGNFTLTMPTNDQTTGLIRIA
jgi:hypothetical protein